MKINDLSNSLGVTNRDLIDFLKQKDFKVSSHLQNATDEMISIATENFSKKETKDEAPVVAKKEVENKIDDTPIKSVKVFNLDDRIACRSVTPWKLTLVGENKTTVYHWENFGDVDYVAYRDLQSWRRKDIITKPKIIIEDPDLCEQWKREIGEIYKPFIGVDYPEELLELPVEELKKLLVSGSDTVREIVKVTAMSMIRHKNYPKTENIIAIDEVLGTCIKEFLF